MPQGWEAPDGSRTVVFARGVVAALRVRTLEAFHSVPRRGAEVGGLLYGRVLRTKPLLARITDFEEIPCQHRFGPSYVLSDEDVPQLEAVLQEERPDPIIGFFRSYTGREMLLDEADRNLLNRYFPDEHSVFLLLQPKSSALCVATFLFPENGEIGWEPPYPSFEFNEAKLSGQTPEPANQARAAAPQPQVPSISPSRQSLTSRILSEAAAGVAAEAPRVQPADETVSHPILGDPEAAVREEPPPAEPPGEPEAEPEPVSAMAASEAVPPPRLLPPPFRAGDSGEFEARRKRGFFLPLLGWIVLCIAAAGVYELWSMARAPRWTPLGLSAQVAPDAIRLSWNSTLGAVRDAKRGTLTISDGTAENRVALTPDQIRSGQYEYRPAARNVLFRLELSGAGIQAAGDSLQVVAAPPPAVAGGAKPAPPRAEAGADRAAEQEREAAEPRPANVAVLPEPLREIHPDIPPGIRARIHDRVVVPVEVKVTAGGRVTSAASHGSGDTLYRYLADRAARAAREWRFSPARARNGRAVPATRTVYFVFRPVG